jgi:hypothetical protein
VRFPLSDRADTNLDTGAAADIATALVSFAHAHDAQPVCGTDEDPPVLEALARRLGGPVRYLSSVELERTALPGSAPVARRELGHAAHQRALLLGQHLHFTSEPKGGDDVPASYLWRRWRWRRLLLAALAALAELLWLSRSAEL